MDRRPAKSFTDLTVAESSLFCYCGIQLSEAFPKNEIYGLTSQLRRAAVSIAANIAEGFGKKTIKDKMRFLDISKGSLEECRYYLILARDLGYSDTNNEMAVLEEVSKLLNASRNSLSNRL